MATIGGIEVQFIQTISLSDGRRNQIIDIPYGMQTGHGAGGQLTRYQIQSAFYGDGDSVSDAKVRRASLRNLVRNFQNEIIKIEFAHDSAELDGWFLIDSIDTDIQGASPNTFDFSLSATRLGGSDGSVGDFAPAIFWNTFPFDNACSAGTKWVSIPNAETDYDEIREGATGECKIKLPAASSNPVTLYSESTTFETSCRIFDTVTPLDSYFTLSTLDSGDESGWAEVETIRSSSGDIILDNGLIRLAINDTDEFGLMAWNPAKNNWHFVSSSWRLNSGTGAAVGDGTFNPPASLVQKDSEKIVFTRSWLDRSTGEYPYTMTVTMYRGSYFLAVKLYLGSRDLFVYPSYSDVSAYFTPSVRPSYSSLHRSHIIGAGSKWFGRVLDWGTDERFIISTFSALCDATTSIDLSNDAPFPANGDGSISEGTTVDLGVFAIPTTLTASSSESSIRAVVNNYHAQYMANMSQQLVLVSS